MGKNLGNMDHGMDSMGGLIGWLRAAPAGTSVDAQELASILERIQTDVPVQDAPEADPVPVPMTWAEMIWLVPAERRLGTREVCEALGKGRTWVHKHLAKPKKDEGPRLPRLPHRKLDGELQFTAGEVRNWIRDAEEEIHGGPMQSTTWERRLRLEDVG